MLQESLNYALIKQQKRARSNRKFKYDVESLLGSFMLISDVIVKAEFILIHDSKISKAICLFDCLAVDGGGVQSSVGSV